ncbi:PKD domain-containing protein [Tabrizicola aquatica]|uniref:PKD domain-containing protein n=1 Tax=Tabrizicola aquatica TaxID=909926 RepID=UPI000CD0D30D|nr:Ig-like domain-containing protein [Tabrizicola aquatica]
MAGQTSRLVAAALLCLGTAQSAQALGPGFIDDGYLLTGHGCNFNIYHDGVGRESQVQLFISGGSGASPTSGGTYWLGGAITSFAPGAITAAMVSTECGISNITGFVSDGANGTYESDDFMGVRFRGTSNADGKIYDYVIGLTGPTTTTVVNTRVEVPNTPPTVNAGSDQIANSGASVTLSGSGTDPDVGQTLTYSWTQISGTSVTLSGSTSPTPSFTAPTLAIGASTVLGFRLAVSDGIVERTDDVQVTVNGPPNTVPVANAGTNATIASGAIYQLDGTGSLDDDGQTLTYAWTQTAGTGVTLSSATVARPSFTAPTLVLGDPAEVLTFSLIVSDGIASSTAATVDITVEPPANRPPVADAGDQQSVDSLSAVTLDGTGSTDPDAGQPLTYTWTQLSGPTMTVTGANQAQASFTAPEVAFGDDPVGLLFSLRVSDGELEDTDLVLVQVSGVNQIPVAVAGDDQTVAAGAPVQLDGTGSFDPDPLTPPVAFIYEWTAPLGSGIVLTGADTATPSFTAPQLAPGVTREVVLTLVVRDGFADSVPDEVSIFVEGPANIAPTADAGEDRRVVSGTATSLDGSGSDANNALQTLTYAWTQVSGPAVTLAGATTVSPTFTAPPLPPLSAPVDLEFQLVVNDGIEESAPATVRITIDPPLNTPPIADAGPSQTVASGALVTLDGRASSTEDVGQTLTYNWVQTSGPGVVLDDQNAAQPTFVAPVVPYGQPPEVLTFDLLVNDGLEDSIAAGVMIEVQPEPNTPPVADAGSDQQVLSEEQVFLDGSNSSDQDVNQPLSYAWQQLSGPTVTLDDQGTATPQFTAPALDVGQPPVQLVFELVVDDGEDSSAPDTVVVTVLPPDNTAPVAVAGADRTVDGGVAVSLDGSASSDADAASVLTYQWLQTSGLAVPLTNASSAIASFTSPVLPVGSPDEVLVFQLSVSDGIATVTDSVSITVEPSPNTPPIVDAGADDSVPSTGSFVVTATVIDPDVGQTQTFTWEELSATGAVLVNDGGPSVTVTPQPLQFGEAPYDIILGVVANDGTDSSLQDTVTITVLPAPNTPPTANAGADQVALASTVVTLTGSGSVAGEPGQTLSYEWSQISGPQVNFVINIANTGFVTPPVPAGAPPVPIVFSLRVFDGFDFSQPDIVEVSVIPAANTAPVADAGPDQDVATGETVSLDGSASSDPDPASGPLTFLWVQTAGPSVSLTDGDTSGPSFTSPAVPAGTVEELTFELRVSDGYSTTTDTVVIRVAGAPNAVPLANAGPDQQVASAASVTLDGSASSDADGSSLSYAWTQLSGPTVVLSSTTSVTPSFDAPVLALGVADAELVFQLVVNDGTVDSPPDTVTITVTAPGSGERPVATLVAVPPSYDGSGPITLTVSFSEPVTGFEAGDLQVTNATASVAGGPQAFTVTLSPTAYPSPITVAVPENVAVDIEGLGNLAAGEVSIGPALVAEASEAVAEAMMQRARALINSQPKLRRFLLPGGSNTFVASVTQNRSTLGLTLGQDSPVWVALNGEWSKTGEDEQDYVNLAFGGHLMRGENVILGAMVQFDDARTVSPTETFRGEGWLVGPYLVIRAAEQPLVFSASILAGETQNSLTRVGLGTDRFDTRRLLLTAGVEGQFVMANGLILIPSFDLAHVRDRQEAYLDAAANLVPEQTVTLTEASFGLGFEKGLRTRTGDVVLTGRVSGIFADESGTDERDRFRGRIDMGADIALSETGSLTLGAYYDGIGAKDYEAWGADLLLQFKF